MRIITDPFMFRVTATFSNGAVYSGHNMAIELPDCFGGEPYCKQMLENLIRDCIGRDDIVTLEIKPLTPTAGGYEFN